VVLYVRALLGGQRRERVRTRHFDMPVSMIRIGNRTGGLHSA
jgi:hypothetical protein